MRQRMVASGLVALALALAGPVGAAETEDAGPIMVGSTYGGGIVCSARNADAAAQMITITATDETGALLGTIGPLVVAPAAEAQLALSYFTVRLKSVTCRSFGTGTISSSISVKTQTGSVDEALEGGNVL